MPATQTKSTQYSVVAAIKSDTINLVFFVAVVVQHSTHHLINFYYCLRSEKEKNGIEKKKGYDEEIAKLEF